MLLFKLPISALIFFLLSASIASADVACSGGKLFNNFFEERWVHHDGSVTVAYPSTSVLRADVLLTLSLSDDGHTKLLASVSRQDNSTQSFSGELSLEQDGKTFSAVLLPDPTQSLPYVQVTGHFEEVPTQVSKEVDFQATGIIFGIPSSFALEQVISTPEDPQHEDATRVSLQCR